MRASKRGNSRGRLSNTALLALVAVLAVVGAGQAQIVDFADPNLEQAVSEELGVPVGEITVTDMEGLTELVAQGKGIVELGGLEYATQLQSLRLFDNQISDLSPLEDLTQLTQLRLTRNSITDLSPLEGLDQLEGLYLSENEITDLLPLEGLSQLQELRLYDNEVSNLSPLEDLTELQVLDLDHNEISDISPLESLTKLEELNLNRNEVSNLSPLGNLGQLVKLYLQVNEISDISAVGGLTELVELNLGDNEISDLSPLAGLTQVEWLWLPGNEITDISALVDNSDAGGLGAGDEVDLRYNQLDTTDGSDAKDDIDTLVGRGVHVEYEPQGEPAEGPIARAIDISGQPDVMYPDVEYTVTAQYFHPEGRAQLKHCYLRLDHPDHRLTMMWYEDGLDAPSGWAEEKWKEYLSITEVDATEISRNGLEGYELAWKFEITDKWPEVENKINFGVYARDAADLTTGWDYDGGQSSFRYADVGNRPPMIVLRHYPAALHEWFRWLYLFADPYYPKNQELILDASWSFDVDGSIVDYHWEFCDGMRASGETVNRTFTERGTHEVQVTVTDNEGAQSMARVTFFIGFAHPSQLDRLRDTVDRLVDYTTTLLEGDIVGGAELAADAALEFAGMIPEDAVGALYSLLGAIVPGSELGDQKSEIWVVLLQSLLKDADRRITERVLGELVTNISGLEGAYQSVVDRIDDRVSEAMMQMGEARSVALDAVETLEHARPSDVQALIRDLGLRRWGNLMMANSFSDGARALETTAHIARSDRDNWKIQSAKFMFNASVSVGQAALAAKFSPVVGVGARLARSTYSAGNALKSANENHAYWLLSHYTLRRGGIEHTDDFPVNVLAAIEDNVLKGLEYVTSVGEGGELPDTVEGEFLSVEWKDGNSLQVVFENTGEHTGTYMITLHADTIFTSERLALGVGRHYSVPEVQVYPDAESGWRLDPKQPKTVTIELPDGASRAGLNLLGESDSGIYGADHYFTVNPDGGSWWRRTLEAVGIRWGSPVEVAVADVVGRVCGLHEGAVYDEIPNAFYIEDQNAIWVTSSTYGGEALDNLEFIVTGTDEGDYRLEVVRGPIGTKKAFRASLIPVSADSQHRYTIDWDALARGKKGVTVEIDHDGDGVFERTVQVGAEAKGCDEEIIVDAPPEEPESVTLSAGWNLVSVPAVPINDAPEAVFEDVVDLGQTLYLYEWDPAAEEYVMPEAINPGRGYWLYLFDPVTVEMRGEVPAGTYRVALDDAGWHKVSSLEGARALPGLRIERGEESRTLAEAIGSGWVSPDIWGYDPETRDYGEPVPGDGALNPWSGYWLYTQEDDLTLVLPLHQPPPPPGVVQALKAHTGVGERTPPPPPPTPEAEGAALEVSAFPNPLTQDGSMVFRATGVPVERLRVAVYDLSGQLVFWGEDDGNTLGWDATSPRGRPVANGVYLYSVQAEVDGEWLSAPAERLLILR